MTDLTALKHTQAAAFAAWKGCPDKNRAEKARLAAELDAATKAVAATKKAANPESAAPTAEQTAQAVAAWNAKQAQAAKEAARARKVASAARKVASAARMFERAHAWPSFGEGWPMDSAERAADKLLRESGAFDENGIFPGGVCYS